MKWYVKAAIVIVSALVTFCIMQFCSGCAYKGAKVVEGSNLAAGFTVPGTEGMVQVNALDWVSGFRLGVAENAALEVKYWVAETNDWLWGMATTRTYKSIDAKVEPCEDAAAATNAPAAKQED